MFNKLRDRFQAHLVRNLVILLVGLTVVGLGIPQALSLHDQSRAGKLLEDYIQREAGDYQGQFACLIPFLADLPASDGEVVQAIDLLHRAVQLTPKQAHVAYLLGKANCLAQDYESAIKTFDGYISSRPDDPLGLMEQAFAYFSLAQTLDETQVDEYARLMDLSRATLKVAGIGEWTLTQHADIAYEDENYRTAWVWYSLMSGHNNYSEAELFQEFISEVIAKQTDSINELSIKNQYLFNLDQELTLTPLNYFDVSDGAPIPLTNMYGQESGVLYTSSNVLGVLFEVEEGAEGEDYCFQIKLFDNFPPPTLLTIFIDEDILGQVELREGDLSWKIISESTTLKSGIHLLRIKFLNDFSENGNDRNAYIAGITLSQCSGNE
ncbi:MAG: tetratricopeptide repeat protein [Anaerolineaceae bacterium]|nr:tetratricopeptide repeat protein [Anaerolineaceae bacterium]